MLAGFLISDTRSMAGCGYGEALRYQFTPGAPAVQHLQYAPARIG